MSLRPRTVKRRSHSLIRSHLVRSCVFLTIVHLSEAAFSGWTEQCKQGGQCATLMSSYEALVMGKECRTLFVTGECSRLCTYSLRALISRKMWNRCARVCDWGEAIVSGADRWLELCLERPGWDVRHESMGSEGHDENEHVEVHGVDDPGSEIAKDVKYGNNSRSRTASKSRRKMWVRAGVIYLLGKVVVSGVLVFVLILVALLAPNTAFGTAIRSFVDIPRWIRLIKAKRRWTPPGRLPPSGSYSRSSSSGRTSTYTRADSRAHRGARRHLVGMVLFT